MQKIFHAFIKLSRLLISVLLALLFLSVLSCTADGVWDILNRQIDTAAEIAEELPGWNRRVKITIDNSVQSETLSDFPVLVKLNAGNITYSDFKPGGTNLSFYNASFDSRLDYEIDTWNTSGDSYMWVKIPSITGSSSTEYFWLYYSSDINTGTEDAAAVWSDDYRGVYHLGESGSSYADSSPFSNTGTGGSAPQTDPALNAVGQIGAGQDGFFNTGSIVVPADVSINDLGPVSYSFWVYYEGDLGEYLLSKDTFRIGEPGGSDTIIRVEIDYSGGTLYREFNCMTNNTWYNITVTWDGVSNSSNLNLYKDGVPLAPGSSANTSGGRTTDAGSPLYIGNNIMPNTVGKQCRLDEFHISGKVRSEDWVYAQYLSQSGSFLTLSAVEEL